jgi:hypothetical protein
MEQKVKEQEVKHNLIVHEMVCLQDCCALCVVGGDLQYCAHCYYLLSSGGTCVVATHVYMCMCTRPWT